MDARWEEIVKQTFREVVQRKVTEMKKKFKIKKRTPRGVWLS